MHLASPQDPTYNVCVRNKRDEREEGKGVEEEMRREEGQRIKGYIMRIFGSGSVPFQSWHSLSSNPGISPTSQAPVEMLTHTVHCT